METEALEISRAQRILNQLTLPLKNAFFGKQNQRLEFLMDSYFKLSTEGRTAVFFGGIALGLLTLVAIIVTYIFALGMLQKQLDDAFAAANKLRDLGSNYLSVKAQFNELEQKISSANQNLVMISLLEQKAKDLGLSTNGFPPQLPVTDFPASNPLSEKYQAAKVEFRVSNISIKKILDFVVAVETSPHMLRVSSLKIKGLYQNKMYFDSTFEVEGTVTKKQ